MKSINLKRFLSKEENISVLKSLTEMSGPFMVTDDKGLPVFGVDFSAGRRSKKNPLKIKEKTVGFLISDSGKGLEAASVLSKFLDSAFMQRVLADELLKKYKEHDLLYSINDETSLCPKTEEIAEFIIRELSRLLDFDFASISLFNENENAFIPISSHGYDSAVENINQNLAQISLKVFESGRGEIVSGTVDYVIKDNGRTDYSVMSVPLKTRKSPSGVILLGSFKRHFSSEDFKILSAVASYIAGSIEIMRLYNVAYYDPLTGLPNRRLFNDHMVRAMARTERSGNFMALCFIDLDGFKGINDKFGHDAGDIILIEVAEKISSVLRKTDMLTRLGGDEFVLLLENFASREDIPKMLFKIENIFSHQYIGIGYGPPVKASFSMGVCVYPNDKGVTTAAAMMDSADKAMYASKKNKNSRSRPWVINGED